MLKTATHITGGFRGGVGGGRPPPLNCSKIRVLGDIYVGGSSRGGGGYGGRNPLSKFKNKRELFNKTK